MRRVGIPDGFRQRWRGAPVPAAARNLHAVRRAATDREDAEHGVMLRSLSTGIHARPAGLRRLPQVALHSFQGTASRTDRQAEPFPPTGSFNSTRWGATGTTPFLMPDTEPAQAKGAPIRERTIMRRDFAAERQVFSTGQRPHRHDQSVPTPTTAPEARRGRNSTKGPSGPPMATQPALLPPQRFHWRSRVPRSRLTVFVGTV